MRTTRYVALLRGINVGGRNPVPMADLRGAFEDAGYASVATYIQSGNVCFASDTPAARLEDDIEDVLERRFGIPIAVVVRSHRQMRSVVDTAPPGFGGDPGSFHSDVVFLKAPLTSRQAMRIVETRDGVDEVWPGSGVLYFARLSARRSESRMSRVAGTPEYRRMTIRNWATTTKLVALLDEQSAG